VLPRILLRRIGTGGAAEISPVKDVTLPGTESVTSVVHCSASLSSYICIEG
jgi:hypothetical protein